MPKRTSFKENQLKEGTKKRFKLKVTIIRRKSF